MARPSAASLHCTSVMVSRMLITRGQFLAAALSSLWSLTAHRQSLSDQVLETEVLHQSNCTFPLGLRVVDVMIPEVGAMQIAVRDHKDIVSDFIMRDGFWEIKHPRELAALADQSLPEAPGTLLDVGAHVGWYTLLFAKIGYNVIAVEPIATNRQAIETSLCLNPDLHGRVRLVQHALVSADDKARQCVIAALDADNLGDGSIRCSDTAEVLDRACNRIGPSRTCEQVSLKTLDEVLSELSPTSVDVVKLDVEDSECNVLRGGQSLFSTFRPKFIQAETIVEKVSGCFKEEAEKHGYVLGAHYGHDYNRVMTPSSFLEDDGKVPTRTRKFATLVSNR